MNNKSITINLTSDRIVWADVLRFIAIFMMISVHCSDQFYSEEALANPLFNYWGTIYQSLLRACVPLFVMLTGMLLLPIKISMEQFYKKRLIRILVPFLIWSVIFNLFPWITGLLKISPDVLSTMFLYAGENPSQLLSEGLYSVLMIPLSSNYEYTLPLWYIYMLIGLYLFIPIFSAWVKSATEKQKRIFLIIWLVSLCLPYVYEFFDSYIFGVTGWNEYGTFYYFSGFIGYLLLGHYLLKGNNWSFWRIALVSLVLFASGYALTFIGVREMTSIPDCTEAQFELFLLYSSPNVLLMTVAIFLVVQKIKIKSQTIKSILANFTKCGLGIYLVHYFFVGTAYYLVDSINTPISIRVPITAIIVVAASWLLTAAIYKLFPKAGKWIVG